MDGIRIICPDSHLNKDERIDFIIREFEKWISDESFVELVKKFGGHIDPKASTTEKVKALKEEFSDKWDFRKHQNSAKTKEGERARWRLRNTWKAIKNKDLIYESAERLGLIGIDTSIFPEADFYLPLGGANMSNLFRCKVAKKEMQGIGIPSKVVALAGMRPMDKKERKKVIRSYAPNAVTEYDAIVGGMKKTFAPLILKSERHIDNDNLNLSSDIKQFECANYEGCQFYTVAAPSTDPETRANSADCFKYFFEEFEVPKHSKLINCTSQIYCSYQQVRALFYAIDHDVNFDTIGSSLILNNEDKEVDKKKLSKPVNYLQEMKGTIDAMYDFVNRYVRK